MKLRLMKKLRLKRTFNGNLKAVSPVIATIIIVAIAITMSIAVAYWLLGLGSSFTKFEKVEFSTAYSDTFSNSGTTQLAATGTWNEIYSVSENYPTYVNITMNLKNTGSAVATIDVASILFNGKPATAYTDNVPIASFTTLAIQPGQSSTGTIVLPIAANNPTWTSGMTVEIMLHTTGGKDYPKVITLP